MLMRFTTVAALLTDLRPTDELSEATLVTKQGRTIELDAGELERLNVALREDVNVLTPTEELDVAEQLLTPEDAATALGVTRQTIYTWQKNGRLGRRLRDGSRVRYVPVADVRKMQEQRRANEEFRAWIMSKPPVSESEAEFAASRFTALTARLREAE